MKRQIEGYLNQWFNDSGRKPLILRGARQVGKTWIVRKFAQNSQLDLIELNFEQNKDFVEFFSNNEPNHTLTLLKSYFQKEFLPQKSLLFLDEIQAAPELLAKLRWFSEKLPELAVIAAGSLLDFTLNEHSFSMPVGRVTYAYLEPLSFEEFLIAAQQSQLCDYLNQYTPNEVVPTPIHDMLMNWLREYFFVGGMPEAVKSWVEDRSLIKIKKIHEDLMTSFSIDFAKYAKKVSHERLAEVLQSIPNQLGQKFQYQRVNPDIKTVAIKQALELLCMARLCQKVEDSNASGLPLAAGVNKRVFKVIFLDIGLVSSLLGLAFHENMLNKDIHLVNEGGLAEQFIGQMLKTIPPFYVEPHLYYWVREKKTSSAEVDYLITEQSQIVPIEVKAGSAGKLKSLHLLMALKEFPLAVRFNGDKPSVTSIEVTSSIKKNASYTLLSLPLYLSNQIVRLLNLLR